MFCIVWKRKSYTLLSRYAANSWAHLESISSQSTISLIYLWSVQFEIVSSIVRSWFAFVSSARFSSCLSNPWASAASRVRFVTTPTHFCWRLESTLHPSSQSPCHDTVDAVIDLGRYSGASWLLMPLAHQMTSTWPSSFSTLLSAVKELRLLHWYQLV